MNKDKFTDAQLEKGMQSLRKVYHCYIDVVKPPVVAVDKTPQLIMRDRDTNKKLVFLKIVGTDKHLGKMNVSSDVELNKQVQNVKTQAVCSKYYGKALISKDDASASLVAEGLTVKEDNETIYMVRPVFSTIITLDARIKDGQITDAKTGRDINLYHPVAVGQNNQIRVVPIESEAVKKIIGTKTAFEIMGIVAAEDEKEIKLIAPRVK